MSFTKLKYLLVYFTPALVGFSLAQEGILTFISVWVLFGVLPALELFLPASTQNMTEAEEAIAKQDKLYDWMLYGLVPVQYILMGYFLYRVSLPELSLLTKIGFVSAYGMTCGILGINAAHELGHRHTWYEQLMSKMLLLSTLYMHFFIEHNRGHHKNVSTDEDPASSKYGETIYAFYARTISGSWLSAWQLEFDRMKKLGLPRWHWKNEMLRFQFIQFLLVLAIGLFFGMDVMCFFLAGATIGFMLLETVNYIEHYGLRRKKSGDHYERTLPIHSWNSNHPLGRLMLLELSRHSDHHFLASRKYQVLRHFDESPQMPTGYPGMMLLALIPPLWFKVMHREINKHKASLQGTALA